MSLLVLRAYVMLIHFHVYLRRGDFSTLYKKIRNTQTSHVPTIPIGVDRICAAVDMACIWYWKEVLCLQRSAATACLLKRYGFPAQMVIGAQQIPFRAHAWVEVDGRVVNDKSYVTQIYAVMNRC